MNRRKDIRRPQQEKLQRMQQIASLGINISESEREAEQLKELIANLDFASENIDEIHKKFAGKYIVVYEPNSGEGRKVEGFRNERELEKFFNKHRPNNPYVTYVTREGEVFIV